MHQPHKLVALIQANCSEVATFALSREPATAMRARFPGWQKPLEKILRELPEAKADRALLELASLLRALDYAESLGDYLADKRDPPYGFLIKNDGTREDLYFRDVANKIVHASAFEWSNDEKNGPVIVCVAK